MPDFINCKLREFIKNDLEMKMVNFFVNYMIINFYIIEQVGTGYKNE
jgi:hypothetical protein